MLQQMTTGALSPQNSGLLVQHGELGSEERKQMNLQKKKSWQLFKQMLNQSKLNLSSSFFDQFSLEEIFDGQRQFNQVEYLWLYLKKNANILKYVSLHAMPRLKILNLGENNIASIQHLQRCNFVELQQLWLWNNKIVSVNCLRKCKLPKLQYLDLSYNFIAECTNLAQLNVHGLKRVNVSNNRLVDVNYLTPLMLRADSFEIQFYNNQLIMVFGRSINLTNRKKVSQMSFKMKGKKACVRYT